MFVCQICSKQFGRGDNMQRHFKTVHADFTDNETIDDSESPENVGDDEGGDKANDSDSSIQDDDDADDDDEAEEEAEEDGNEEDSDDPWCLLMEEVFQWCQSEFDERVINYMAKKWVDEEDARKNVYDNMLPTYRKTLANVFVNEILWFEATKKDRIYLTVKNTVSDLKLLDNYDTEEAWKSAVSKRKFLFVRILKEYDPPELSDPRDYDGGQTEKQRDTTSKAKHDQEGGGRDVSDKLKVNLVSPTEGMALRAKEELLREGRKRGFDSFTPEDAAEIERRKKRRRSEAPWTIIQKV